MDNRGRRARVVATAAAVAGAVLIGWAAVGVATRPAGSASLGLTSAVASAAPGGASPTGAAPAPPAGAAAAPPAGAAPAPPAGSTRPRPAAPPHPSHAAPTRPSGLTPARLVAGAGRLPAGWVATAHTIDVAGLARVYLTVEPAVLNGPVPVVVLMHGRGMTPDGILHVSDLARQVGPAVLIVPEGWHESWNAGDCCGAAWLHRINDVAFISDAVAGVLAATPDAQAARIYAVGFSNGGRMAYTLACRMPWLFAGFMAVEAVPVEACPSGRPVDITIVAQQRDPLLALETGQAPKTIGGFVEPTVSQTLHRLATLDRCAGAPTVTASGLSVERTWTCPGGTLRYVWYPAGGHSWRAPKGSTPGATAFVLQMIGRGGPPSVPARPGAGDTAASVTAMTLPSHGGAEGRASVGR